MSETLDPRTSGISRALSAFRVAIALLFLQHPVVRFVAWPHVSNFDTVRMLNPFWIVGVLELAAGGLLLLGCFTRFAALLLAIEMAVTCFLLRSQPGLFPLTHSGLSLYIAARSSAWGGIEALYSVVFLYLTFAGPGYWSFDEWRRRALRILRP